MREWQGRHPQDIPSRMCAPCFEKSLRTPILNTEQGHSAGDSTLGDIIFGCKLISRPAKKLKSDNLGQREKILKNIFLLWKVTNSDCVKMAPFYSMVHRPCSNPLHEVEFPPPCIFWIISAELKQRKVVLLFTPVGNAESMQLWENELESVLIYALSINRIVN